MTSCNTPSNSAENSGVIRPSSFAQPFSRKHAISSSVTSRTFAVTSRVGLTASCAIVSSEVEGRPEGRVYALLRRSPVRGDGDDEVAEVVDLERLAGPDEGRRGRLLDDRGAGE